MEVKNKSPQDSLKFIIGWRFLHIEISECNIGVKQRADVFDGRGVSDDGASLQ